MVKQLIHRYQESIGLQVFWVKTILIFGVVIAITVISIQNQKRLLLDELENRGRLLINVLSNGSRLAVFSENKPLIKGQIDGVIGNTSVSEIIVFNSDKEILVQKDKNRPVQTRSNGAYPEEHNDFIEKVAETRRQILNRTESRLEIWQAVFSEQIFDANVPVQNDKKENEILGFIKLTLDKRTMNAQLRGTVLKHITAGFVVWLVSLFFSYKTSKTITQPIKRLTTAVNKIEIEGFGQSIPVETKKRSRETR